MTGSPRPALGALALAAMLLSAAAAATAQQADIRPPFVPTPRADVVDMLEMAEVREGDILYDLGSGDGRIPIAAVRDFGVNRAVGFDIDPALVRESIEAAAREGVADRVRFFQGDVFEVDFSAATVVTMYLLQDVNLRLRPRLLELLRPGTRIVSYEFDLGDWEPDRIHPAHAAELRRNRIDVDEMPRTTYFWIVPDRFEGRWEIVLGDGGGTRHLVLEQRFQEVTGTLRAGDGSGGVALRGRIEGDRIGLAAGPDEASASPMIEARKADGALRGTIRLPDGSSRAFRATRREP